MPPLAAHLRSIALVALTAGLAVAHAQRFDQQIERQINEYRSLAGLPSVTLDPELSQGCMEHTKYLVLNQESAAVRGMAAHRQQKDLPGASPKGAACAADSDISPGARDVLGVVDGLMAGIYHRRPVLEPGLKRIGVGYAKSGAGSYTVAIRLPHEADANSSYEPVLFPADGQHAVPLQFQAEIPSPIPGGGEVGGYPITLQFAIDDTVEDVKARLTMNGQAVPFYLSSPENPATDWERSAHIVMVGIIPKAVLRADSTYQAQIQLVLNGERRTWKSSFTTGPEEGAPSGAGTRPDATEVPAEEQASVLATERGKAISATEVETIVMAASAGRRITVFGNVLFGGWTNANTAFLVLTDRRSSGEQIAIVIPQELWQQLADADEPTSWKGRRVVVDSSPYRGRPGFINLPITSASQLHTR